MRTVLTYGIFVFLLSSFTLDNSRSYYLRDIQFEVNSDRLMDTQLKELETAIKTIRESMEEGHEKTFTLWINGNADVSEKYVMRLSANRAKVVRDKLLSLGLNEGTLIAKGFGKRRPIADSNTEDGRKRNARVDFQIRLE